MGPSRITYSIDSGRGRSILSILVAPGTPAPPAQILRWFHHAVDQWEKRNPRTAVRTEPDEISSPDTTETTSADYLYGDGTFNGDRLHRHLSMLAEHGSIHRSIPQPGAPVEGRDMWGRDRERDELVTSVRRHSCHVQGPRRYGKTSLLRSLDQALALQGSPAVMADVSASADAAEFFATVVTAAMERPLVRPELTKHLRELRGWPEPGPASNADERSTARTGLLKTVRVDPLRFGSRLLEGLTSAAAVLVIDEFSLFLRNLLHRSTEDTKALLDLLRQTRHGRAALRQVVAGSAGLSSFARFHGLGEYLDDLLPVPVGPLDAAVAGGLAEELFYGSGLRPTPGAAASVLDDIGLPVPYFVQPSVMRRVWKL